MLISSMPYYRLCVGQALILTALVSTVAGCGKTTDESPSALSAQPIITDAVTPNTFTAIKGSKPHSNPEQSQNSEHNQNASASARSYISSNQCFNVTTNIQQQAQVNEYFSAQFTLQKSCITPDAIGDLSFYASMPAHGHGTNNQPVVTQVAANTYEAAGVLLHMGGEWKIVLEIPYLKHNQQHLELISFFITL